MTQEPKIPMSPTELPKQRITAVVSLPSRPAGFVGDLNLSENIVAPANMPRTAKYIGQFEWAWGPNNCLLVAYYLSSNRKRTHWLLWLRLYDDNWSRWDKPYIYAHAPRQEVSEKVAAIYLLWDSWASDAQTTDLSHFHWINEAGFLSVEELNAIGRGVWPERTAKN